MKILRLFAATMAVAFSATTAMAQDFPKKQPIKLVVPFNVGGLADVLARITADALSRRIGQAVVVENKPGAASAIASDYVAKAPPDGYTLMLSTADLAVLPAVRRNLPYKFENFTYLTLFSTRGVMLVVGPRSPYTSAADLMDDIKANPGKLSYGTPGIGTLNHLGNLQLLNATGRKANHVPFTGAAQIYTALMGGHLDYYNGATQPFPEALRILAVTKRHPNYPQVPTFEELGYYKDETHVAWYGIIAPPNVPKNVSDKLIAELRAVFEDPAVIAKFKSSSNQGPDVKIVVGEEFRQRVLREFKVWKEAADREKIEIQ